MTKNANIRYEIFDVYCGRGKNGLIPSEINHYGWLGNPVKIGYICPICGITHLENSSTLPCYEKYLRNKIESPIWKDAFIKTCKNKILGCFCKPKACHTDIMIKVLNEI